MVKIFSNELQYPWNHSPRHQHQPTLLCCPEFVELLHLPLLFFFAPKFFDDTVDFSFFSFHHPVTSFVTGAGYGGGGGGSFGGGGNGLSSTLHQIDFHKQELVTLEKDFYIEHPDVTKRPEAEAEAWRASKQIVVIGEGVPKPCMTFDEASMPEYILTEVLKQGFDKPTPIQSQGWPMALKGKNMVGISATGSGKTLAFLLPAMIHINAQVSFLSLFSGDNR